MPARARLAPTRSVAGRIETADERVAWFVLVATIPAGVDRLRSGRTRSPTTWASRGRSSSCSRPARCSLYWADRSPESRSMGDLDLGQAVVMGFAQALALAPGVSRSGITITAGRFMKLDRDSAARFSFYLLMPTVLGAVLLKGVKDVVLRRPPARVDGPFLVGTLAALGSGLLAIEWLLGYVRTTHVRRVRRLPPRRRGTRAARDRQRRARRHVLARRRVTGLRRETRAVLAQPYARGRGRRRSVLPSTRRCRVRES